MRREKAMTDDNHQLRHRAQRGETFPIISFDPTIYHYTLIEYPFP